MAWVHHDEAIFELADSSPVQVCQEPGHNTQRNEIMKKFKRWSCVHEGDPYEVYGFASSEARDTWRAIAERSGAEVIDEGGDWIAISDQAPDRSRRKRKGVLWLMCEVSAP